MESSENVYMQEQKKHPMQFGCYTLPEQWQLDAMERYAALQLSAHCKEKEEWVRVIQKPDQGQDVICTQDFEVYSIGWYSDPEGFFTDKDMVVSHWKPFLPTPPTN